MNRFKMLLLTFSLALAVSGVQAQDATPDPTAGATPEVTFPLTLTHSLGTIEIPAPPERIVALGPSDMDTAYGLGYVPVGISTYAYAEDGITPWLRDYTDPEVTALLPYGDFSFETLVALQPDVILAGGLYNIGELYPSLAEIAPTTAWISGNYEDSWQEQTLNAGQALGKPVEAQALVDETEAAIEAVRSDYAALEGKTFSLSYLYDTNGIASIYSQDDFAVQFMQSLGFVLTPRLTELGTREGNAQAALSLETLQLIDADLVVLAFGSPELQATYEANPLYQQLGAVQDGRVIVANLDVITQLRTPSVLGIPWVLEQLRPGFETLAEAR